MVGSHLNNNLSNCPSVFDDSHVDPTEIGFARSGMGKYFYLLFKDSIPKSEMNKWNDGNKYIYHEHDVVLSYGGGAVGSDWFPKNERE